MLPMELFSIPIKDWLLLQEEYFQDLVQLCNTRISMDFRVFGEK